MKILVLMRKMNRYYKIIAISIGTVQVVIRRRIANEYQRKIPIA